MSTLRAIVNHWRLALCVIIAIAAQPRQGRSQPTAPPVAPSSASDAEFRRIFVPADRPEAWPTDEGRYLPVGKAEFERLIEAAKERHQLAKAGGAQLVSARYKASLADDLTLIGNCELQINLIDAAPQIFTLSPFNLAVVDGDWKEGDGEPVALLGAWSRDKDAERSYGVLVERSGKLALNWLARSTSGSQSQLIFQLRLPLAVQQQFVLDLPTDCTPSLESASLVSREALGDRPFVRWTFQVGPSVGRRLEIRRSEASATAESRLPLVSVTEAYSIAPRGLDYSAELRIQLRTPTQTELRVAIPEALRISEVLMDRLPADWRHDDGDARTIIIPLPKTAAPIHLTVRGAGDVVLNTTWRLPGITCENAFWTEGAATLWIDPALELQSIQPSAASLLNSVGVGRAFGGEAYRLQAWASDAFAEVHLGQREPILHARSGVVAEFAERDLNGRCQVQLWATHAPMLHVAAALAPDWNLESVEATPPDALTGWHVAGEGDERRLHLQFRRSPTEVEPIRLAVAARKPLRGWAPVASLGELNWLRFPGAETMQGHLLVKSRGGGELRIGRTPANQPDLLVKPTEAIQQLLGEDTDGLLLDTASIDPQATVRVVAAPPRFQGEARIELSRTETGFQHQAELLCRPTAGAVSELLVAAARPLPAQARWTLLGSDEPVVVQQAAATTSKSDGDAPVEYRVQLASPRSAQFRLRINWRADSPAAEAINSISLPGAESWQSWAILRGNPSQVRVDARGCTPVAAIPADLNRRDVPDLVGCFRLGDDPSAPLALTPILAMRKQVAGDNQGATCWQCDVTTLQFRDGNQSHRFAYALEVHSANAVDITVPEEFEVTSARVDDLVIPLRSEELASSVRIPLPPDRRRVTLTLDVHGRRRPLRGKVRISPPVLQTSFPVVRGQWTVAAPAPFTVESEQHRQLGTGWRQRLFGPLVDQAGGEAPRFLGLSTALGASPDSQQATRRVNGSASLTIPQGWSAASQEFILAPAPMQIRRLDEARGMWHVAWLLAAVAATFLWPFRPRWVAMTAGLMAVASLILPVAWIVLPQAILLGSIAGAVVRQVFLATPRRLPAGSTRGLVASSSSLLLVMATFDATAHAAGPSTPPQGVLYPIGADGKPAGGDVYVPEALLTELIPAARKGRAAGASSVLLSASYQVRLSQEAGRGAVVCTGGTLRFRWQTFRADVTIDLPLQRQEAEWLADKQTLDGKPAVVRWNDSGVGCSLDIADPGVHELQLELAPHRTGDGDHGHLHISVPQFPGALLEIIHPSGLEEVVVGSMQIAATTADPTRTRTELPPGDALEVAWSPRLPNLPSGMTVDQLLWLDIDPAAARLNARLRVSGDASSMNSMELATSPQLKLMPLPEGSPVEVARTTSGFLNTAELRFRTPPKLPLTIPLQFQLQRLVSVGHLKFPSMRLLGVHNGTRHYAVSVDRRLQLHEQSPIGLTPASIDDLEQAWGSFETAPAAQYVGGADEPIWTMHLEPSPPQFTPRENLELLCGADGAEVAYSAAIDAVQGALLTHRLTLPPDMKVAEATISVGAEHDAVAVRWSRPRPDQLVVFLSRPLSEAHTLRVAGHIEYGEERRLPAPEIGLGNTFASAINVSVRRTEDVVVGWSADAEAPPPAPAAAEAGNGAGMAFGRFSVPRASGKTPVLQISPNDAHMSADALLTLNLAPTQPEGVLLVRGRVTSGIVDHIRLLVSKDWKGPFKVDPPAHVMVAPTARDANRHVVDIRLGQPVAAGGELAFKLAGSIALQADQRVRVPNIRILEADAQQVFVALPNTPANQSADWTYRGLVPRRLPQELSKLLDQSNPPATLLVERDRYVVEQRVFPDALRKAATPMVETAATLDVSGQWSAVATLFVQPGGASAVAVKLPEGTELLYAAVDDRIIEAPAVIDGRLQLPPGSQYLPRIVTLAYRLRTPDSARRFELQSPQASVNGKLLPAKRSLWRLDGEAVATLRVEEAGLSITARSFAQMSRSQQVAILTGASPLAFQLPAWELHPWFAPWVRRLEAENAAGEQPSSDASDAEWAKLRQRLAAAGVDAAPEELDDLGGQRGHEVFLADGWYVGDSAGTLTLERVPAGFGAARWCLALIIAAAWGAAWLRPERVEPLLSAMRRWPAVLGVAAGAVWWALLSPAMLGPVMIAFSLAALFKNRQRLLAARQPGKQSSNLSTTAGSLV